MIEAPFDVFTVHHALAAFAIGFFLSLFIQSLRKTVIFAFVVPVFWEVLEQNVLVSWTDLLEAESIWNSLADIGVGFSFIMLGFVTGSKILKK